MPYAVDDAGVRSGNAGPSTQDPAKVAIRSLIAELASDGSISRAAEQIIKILRTDAYSIADLLADIQAVRAGADQRVQASLDELLRLCVQRTALVHEKAVETMHHGFCELDAQQRLLYANRALLELVPDCIGRRLRDLFDDRDRVVDQDLSEVGMHGLRRLELRTPNGSRAVLAEIGALDAPPVAFYVVLADMTEREEAERQVHDRAEFGILRLDPAIRITYVNRAACQLLDREPHELVGRRAADLVPSPEDRRILASQIKQREHGVSSEYELTLQYPGSPRQAVVKVRSLAELGPDDELTGIFATLSPLDVEKAAETLQAAIAQEHDPRALFDKTVELLEPLVPFDHLSLSIFTKDRRYSRALFMAPGSLQTEARWFPIPESLRNIHVGDKPFGDDLAAMIEAAEGGRELLDHPAVREFLDKGLKSWITVPIQGEFDAALTLNARQPGAYGRATVAKLAKIGVANAMQGVLRLVREKEEQFRLELIKDMAQQCSDVALAELTVGRLASFYDWHNVSVLKVNRFRKRFVLLRQAKAEGGFLLPAPFEQPLDKGLLGEALETNDIVLAEDTDLPPFAARFQRASEHTRSELCIPIRVQGRVTWILNIEDRRPFAFTEAERGIIGALMEELEPPLERALSAALFDQVIDDSPDGIIVTDANGCIVRCNLSAREMLDGEHLGEDLATFFVADSDGAEAVLTTSNIEVPVEARVIGSEGSETEVLVRARIPRDESDRRIVVLQDRQDFEWQAEAGRLMGALADLAAEVRIPLSLASTFLNQIRRTTADTLPGVAEIAGWAIEQLGRVDLSYGRVIDRADAAGPSRVDVGKLVAGVVDVLDDNYRPLVCVDPPGEPCVVWADPSQLSAAVHSMLAYLIRVGDPAGGVSIRVRPSTSSVYVTMLKPDAGGTAADQPGHAGTVSSMIETARARAALNEARLVQFATHAGGLFRRRRSREGETLRLVLPAGD